MKRRWRLALAAAGVLAALVLVPVGYIEGTCRTPVAGYAPGSYSSRQPAAEHRAEARTFLTYPEWHIVYSAESLGRWLAAGHPPSDYRYGGDIMSFWRSYCTVNRVTAGSAAAGDAKVMIYTIGISYTLELAVKAAWERTIGRFTQWASGWRSADDVYAAGVQLRYGAFMHETPWYRFPFGRALAGEWRTHEPDEHLRHAERRVALSLEYGVKALYAKAIGWASGAALGRDAPTLRFVARAAPARIAAIDPRLMSVRSGGGLVVVEAPRYAQFSDLLARMAAARVRLVEIAGNDDIFVTLVAPDGAALPGTLMTMPLPDRPGWRRVGVAVKVPALLPLLRAQGGRVEHVYDY